MASSGQAGGLGKLTTSDSKAVSLVDWQIPDGNAGCCIACVAAISLDSGLAKMWQFSFGVKSFKNNIAVIGVPKEVDSYGEPGTEDWNVTISVSGDVFQLLVAGVDGLAIEWAGTVDSVLVGG